MLRQRTVHDMCFHSSKHFEQSRMSSVKRVQNSSASTTVRIQIGKRHRFKLSLDIHQMNRRAMNATRMSPIDALRSE